MEKRMNDLKERRNILIIYGYHPKETFAKEIGESLVGNFFKLPVQVVKYIGKQDRGCSTRNLRRFVSKFGLSVLPVVLHNDRKTDMEAIIIYCARSAKEKRKSIRSLFSFVSKYNKKNITVIFDTVLIANARHSLIEIEFNQKIGFKKAQKLVRDISKHMINF